MFPWEFDTLQKMKFSVKGFFSKCDQIRSFLWILSQILKKSYMKTLFFVQCYILVKVKNIQIFYKQNIFLLCKEVREA